MKQDMINWLNDKDRESWEMPEAHWLKRLPIVRHIRAIILGHQVDRHEAHWRAMGSIPGSFDRWIVFGVWHGKERPRTR